VTGYSVKRDIGAVVLAGGFGTRIRHLVGDLPKPLVPVCGQPFLHWVLRFLVRQGISRAAISTHYKGEKVTDFANQFDGDLEIQCVREDVPLGTAGGFLHAAAALRPAPEGYLVLNGDSLTLALLDPLVEAAWQQETVGAILGIELADASRYGRIASDVTGRLVEFAEKQPGPALVNAGIYLFRPAALVSFPVKRPLSFEYEAFPQLIAAGHRIAVARARADFLDIGTESSLGEAEQFIAANQRWF
jgi:D-glycero-alpha-D-manno-heptose 1-phosphate guanylyltransferase